MARYRVENTGSKAVWTGGQRPIQPGEAVKLDLDKITLAALKNSPMLEIKAVRVFKKKAKKKA